MVIISYLYRTPRYENITLKDIELMAKYFDWQWHNEHKTRHSCDTFRKWCSHDESELPSKEVLDYFKQFSDNLIEEVARIPKTNQIDNWFIKNVMNGTVDKEYHEVTKQQLEELLNECRIVLNGCEQTGHYEYIVNQEVAEKHLPIMEKWFYGADEYCSIYAYQIAKAMEQIANILRTTDFEKQTIYYQISNR